jgi:hypothetical protein
MLNHQTENRGGVFTPALHPAVRFGDLADVPVESPQGRTTLSTNPVSSLFRPYRYGASPAHLRPEVPANER